MKRKIRKSFSFCLFLTFLITSFFETKFVFGQENLVPLELNNPIDAQIKAGESNSYRIKLEKDQYLYLTVDFKDIDLDVKLFSSNGEKLYESGNLSGVAKTKTVFFVTNSSGDYRLEITGRRDGKPQGSYKAKIVELRAADERDRVRASGEKIFVEGELLNVLNKAETTREAIEKYKQAIPLFHSSGERSREAAALSNLGLAYYTLGQRTDAVANFNEVLSIARAIGDRNLEAEMLNNLGTIYNMMGQNQKALESLNQSLVIVRELKLPEGEASILNNLASIYKERGEFDIALEYAEKSAIIHRETGNRRGEANSYNSIGAIYDDLGDPQKALNYYRQSLDIHQKTGNVRSQAVTLNNIGVIYSKLGDKERALDTYLQVLSLVRESGNKVGEARTLSNIGAIYKTRGEGQKALEYLEQSLAMQRTAKDLLGEAITLTEMGTVYSSLGDRAKAVELYTKALEISRNIEARHQEAIILQQMGKVSVSQNETDRALEYFNQALLINQKIAEAYNEAGVLADIARVEYERGVYEKAQTHIEEVLKIIEDYRAEIVSPDLRDSYLAATQNYYKLYIDVLMRLYKQNPSAGYDAKALQVSEQERARSLIETLAESRSRIRQGVDLQLLKREQDLQKQINKKENQRMQLSNRKGTENQLKTVESELKSLLNQYKEIRSQIRALSPRYAAFTEPQPLSLQEIQKMLDSETILLEYSLGKEKSYVWAVTQNSLKAYELTEGKSIEAAARRAYELVIERNREIENETAEQMQARFEKAELEFPIALKDLSEIILSPVAAQLGKKRLLVVAEGALQYIPFNALSLPTTKTASIGRKTVKENYQPLILNHEVIILPSASTLAVLRRKNAEQNKTLNSVAVFADPVFSKNDLRVAQSIARLNGKTKIEKVGLATKLTELADAKLKRSAEDSGIGEFRRLRFSRREADQIVSLVPQASSLEAVDFAADKNSVTNKKLNRFQILHFATHGLLDSKNPELSGIVLSLVDEEGNPQDGFLRLHEIYNLQLDADLVVLSACQTALGKDVKGEGLIGLTRGFMYAGADSVIASLWKIEDRASAEIMERFYRAVFKGKQKPAAALRTAQIEMWRQPQWRNPYYWAAFTIQGEWK